ncbi:flavin-containing monooxygenase [Prauserella oleivorans]
MPGAHRLARTAIDLAHEALVPGLVAEPALLKGAELLARAHLHRQVRDARLRAKLTPDYAFGCKRPTFSNDYYPALGQPNVEVVTASIDEIRPHGIVTVDGRLHELDTIVLSTGFRMTDHPMFPRVRGRAGTTLAEAWSGGPQAYLGTTVSGFPNLFFLLGPNSVVYTSQVVTIEAQVAYLLSALRTMGAHGLASVDVRREVQSAFAGEVDRRLSTSVWNTGGCRSYYLDDAGRNFTFYPGFARRFRARTRSLDLGGYTCTPARPAGELSETARTA